MHVIFSQDVRSVIWEDACGHTRHQLPHTVRVTGPDYVEVHLQIGHEELEVGRHIVKETAYHRCQVHYMGWLMEGKEITNLFPFK